MSDKCMLHIISSLKSRVFSLSFRSSVMIRMRSSIIFCACRKAVVFLEVCQFQFFSADDSISCIITDDRVRIVVPMASIDEFACFGYPGQGIEKNISKLPFGRPPSAGCRPSGLFVPYFSMPPAQGNQRMRNSSLRQTGERLTSEVGDTCKRVACHWGLLQSVKSEWMGLVRITSWYPEFNGSHFAGLPPSSIHRMTGLGGKMVWTMTHSNRRHYIYNYCMDCATLCFTRF